jgi:betaine-homocysteine S-methyltransferase
MFEEQVGWAAEAGVDYIIAETIPWLGEAEVALDVMKRAKLPIVVTFARHREGLMRDGFTPVEAAKRMSPRCLFLIGPRPKNRRSSP